MTSIDGHHGCHCIDGSNRPSAATRSGRADRSEERDRAAVAVPDDRGPAVTQRREQIVGVVVERRRRRASTERAHPRRSYVITVWSGTQVLDHGVEAGARVEHAVDQHDDRGVGRRGPRAPRRTARRRSCAEEPTERDGAPNPYASASPAICVLSDRRTGPAHDDLHDGDDEHGDREHAFAERHVVEEAVDLQPEREALRGERAARSPSSRTPRPDRGGPDAGATRHRR